MNRCAAWHAISIWTSAARRAGALQVKDKVVQVGRVGLAKLRLRHGEVAIERESERRRSRIGTLDDSIEVERTMLADIGGGGTNEHPQILARDLHHGVRRGGGSERADIKEVARGACGHSACGARAHTPHTSAPAPTAPWPRHSTIGREVSTGR